VRWLRRWKEGSEDGLGWVDGSLDDAEAAVSFSKVGLEIWPVLGVDGAAAPDATWVRVQASL
jgi:hypothetical protein